MGPTLPPEFEEAIAAADEMTDEDLLACYDRIAEEVLLEAEMRDRISRSRSPRSPRTGTGRRARGGPSPPADDPTG